MGPPSFGGHGSQWSLERDRNVCSHAPRQRLIRDRKLDGGRQSGIIREWSVYARGRAEIRKQWSVIRKGREPSLLSPCGFPYSMRSREGIFAEKFKNVGLL